MKKLAFFILLSLVTLGVSAQSITVFTTDYYSIFYR